MVLLLGTPSMCRVQLVPLCGMVILIGWGLLNIAIEQLRLLEWELVTAPEIITTSLIETSQLKREKEKERPHRKSVRL